MMHEIFIPDRFRKIVTLHIVKNLMQQTDVRNPLILGIHGPSGDGKTFQCESILAEMGARSYLISGGQLESGQAGEPAKIVRDTYLKAGQSILKGETKVAIMLINDVDTGLGNWGDLVQTTINTQTVYGELMHLVDYPTSVEGRITKRIPIIITGNDFTKLYAPLVRAGRMAAFEWAPTLEEKAQMITKIFDKLLPQECLSLVKEFKSQPIAFYAHLYTIVRDNELWEDIQKMGIREVIDKVSNGIEPSFRTPLSYDQLLKVGKALLDSGQLVNHLKGNRK